MTDREVEPHSSNSQKELPTILRFHVKHQLLGNDEEENSSQIPSPHNSTTPSYVSRETIGLLQRRHVSRETFREVSAKFPISLYNAQTDLSLMPIPLLGKRLYFLKLWQLGRVKWTTCFCDLPFA